MTPPWCTLTVFGVIVIISLYPTWGYRFDTNGSVYSSRKGSTLLALTTYHKWNTSCSYCSCSSRNMCDSHTFRKMCSHRSLHVYTMRDQDILFFIHAISTEYMSICTASACIHYPGQCTLFLAWGTLINLCALFSLIALIVAYILLNSLTTVHADLFTFC
jgi:hypothetical protein